MWQRPSIIMMLLAISLLVSCSQFASTRVTAGPAIRDGQVLFRYYAPTARRVQLTGNWPFNNWGFGDGDVGEANIGLMSDEDGDGVWEIAVDLGPGRYLYLFWIDENTYDTDPGNREEVSGGPREIASLLVVFDQAGELSIR